MRRILLVVWLALPVLGLLHAQDQPYRVVFDLTSRDSLDQKVVMPEKSTVLADVNAAIKNPNVTFKVCEIALKNNKTDKNQLLKEVQTVPDGIYELVSKQQHGWGYIKVVH